MKVKVNAKLNLTLGVVGNIGKFHAIDSVVTSVDVCDVVEILPRNDFVVTVGGMPWVPDERNTAYRMATALVQKFGVNGADIVVQKGIPVGAGMGGSSADAAAVAAAFCKMYGLEKSALRDVCATVGSDVWYMVSGGFARMTGVGNDVEFFDVPDETCYVVTTFDTSCSAGEVYGWFDECGRRHLCDNDEVVRLLKRGDADSAAKLYCNDLQTAVQEKTDYADKYLFFCGSRNIRPVMTGSGSAYFVAFADPIAAQNICDILNENGYKSFVCKSVKHGVTEVR